MDKFQTFLTTLKRSDNAELIQCVNQGYMAIDPLMEGRLSRTLGLLGLIVSTAMAGGNSVSKLSPALRNIVDTETPQQLSEHIYQKMVSGQNVDAYMKALLQITKSTEKPTDREYGLKATTLLKKQLGMEDKKVSEKSKDESSWNITSKLIPANKTSSGNLEYEVVVSVEDPDLMDDAIKHITTDRLKEYKQDAVQKVINDTLSKVQPGQTKLKFRIPYYIDDGSQ